MLFLDIRPVSKNTPVSCRVCWRTLGDHHAAGHSHRVCWRTLEDHHAADHTPCRVCWRALGDHHAAGHSLLEALTITMLQVTLPAGYTSRWVWSLLDGCADADEEGS